MFQFAGFASVAYGFSYGYPIRGGFPHSDIHGSKLALSSPWLFAECHVLHRLLTPRHPPDALLLLEKPRAGISPGPKAWTVHARISAYSKKVCILPEVSDPLIGLDVGVSLRKRQTPIGLKRRKNPSLQCQTAGNASGYRLR